MCHRTADRSVEFAYSLLSLTLVVLLSSCATTKNPWSAVTLPTKTVDAQTIGSPAAGCIAGAILLPKNGNGFQVMRLSRNRFYGHPSLVRFVEAFAQKIATQGLGPIFIGDLSQPRGGPTLSSHRSHQTGLDVDIWFWQPEMTGAPLTDTDREDLKAHSMVSEDRVSINSQYWSPSKAKILRTASEFEEVDRIFVNPVIKRELCTQEKEKKWLQKIRPWWGHDAHFHVRLKCPNASPTCTHGNVDPLPSGDGCDETLAWWFSEEAKQAAKEQAQAGPPKMPVLPDECQAVLEWRE